MNEWDWAYAGKTLEVLQKAASRSGPWKGKCTCSGCQTLIPAHWKADICLPCAGEVCQHTVEERNAHEA